MDASLVALLAHGLLGLAYGVVLQRSGFCFARVTFELFLLRSRDALNGVLAGLAVATVGFAAVSLVRGRLGLPTSDHLLLLPFGPGTLFGAAIFGFGMTLAGMCVVGSLLRLGEGYVLGAVALCGMALGAALDPFRALLPRGLGTPVAGSSLSSSLGIPGAVLATLALLTLVWWVARRISPATRPVALTPAVIGGALLALLNIIQMAAYSPWTIAYPLALVVAAAERRLHTSLISDALPLILLDLGVVVGALASALTTRDLRLRRPRHWRQPAVSLAGGILMGWGVQLSHGCNIGGLFSALPSLSISAWLFLPGLFLGAWLGSFAARRIA